MQRSSLKHLTLGGIIAALYAALTLFSAVFGLAIGPFEFRLSEALAILPLFTPAAVPGLFCGCLAANLLCGANVFDLIFGSLASLLGALGTRHFRDRLPLAFLCPILTNTLLVPPILYFAYGFRENSFLLLLLVFFVGEAGSVAGLGSLLRKALLPFQNHFQ